MDQQVAYPPGLAPGLVEGQTLVVIDDERPVAHGGLEQRAQRRRRIGEHALRPSADGQGFKLIGLAGRGERAQGVVAGQRLQVGHVLAPRTLLGRQ